MLALLLAGCAGWWPSDDSDRIRDGIEELATVRGPDGESSIEVRVVGCDDSAEQPMAVATFPLDPAAASDLADVDARNAEVDDLTAWFLPRWEDLGWEVDAGQGSATKVFAGRRMRATVDEVQATTYSVVVSRDGGALCS